MALTRWQPFQELINLSNAMDRLFDDRFLRPLRIAEGMAMAVPMDVYEANDKYVVEAALPGANAEDVDISIQGNTVTISGNLPVVEDEGRTYLLRERVGGKFTRTLTLPVEADVNKVEATFRDGVLHVELPKAPAYQTKTSAIKSGR